MNMILVGLVLFRDMPFTLLVNVLVDWITKSVRMIRLKINLIMKPLDKPARAFYSSNIRAHPVGKLCPPLVALNITRIQRQRRRGVDSDPRQREPLTGCEAASQGEESKVASEPDR